MSDEPVAPDEEPEEPVEEADPAIIPVLDGEGGTKYVVPGTDEEKTYEDWAAQNAVPVPAAAEEPAEEAV